MTARTRALVGPLASLLAALIAGCAQAPTPGLLGWRLGPATPLIMLGVYALYGATLGYVYVVISP